MTEQEFEKRCLAKPEVERTFPFGPEAAVFKVAGKVFAIVSDMNGSMGVNLKCEPDEAVALRSQYPTIKPGYHMNKEHWNTVDLTDELPDALFQYLLDNSYLLVVSGMKKSERERFRIVYGIAEEE